MHISLEIKPKQTWPTQKMSRQKARQFARTLIRFNGVIQTYVGMDHTDILVICAEDGYQQFLNLAKKYSVANPRFIHDYERVLNIAAIKIFEKAGKDLPSMIDYFEDTSDVGNVRNLLKIYLLPLDWKSRTKEIQTDFPFINENFMSENVKEAELVGNKYVS